jgi:hypothetical protein
MTRQGLSTAQRTLYPAQGFVHAVLMDAKETAKLLKPLSAAAK